MKYNFHAVKLRFLGLELRKLWLMYYSSLIMNTLKIWNIFDTTKSFLVTLYNQFPQHPHPCQPWSDIFTHDFASSRINEIIPYVTFLYLLPFIFFWNSHITVFMNSFFFNWGVYCMDVPHFVYPFTSWQTFGMFLDFSFL